MKRRIYLRMKPLDEAGRILQENFPPGSLIQEEIIRSSKAAGRVTSRPVYARYSTPAFHSAAMDGMAVRARDTFGASEQAPRVLEVPEQAVPINTGRPLPEGMDAVIMIEHVVPLSGDRIEIRRPAYPWQHVRKVGEDMVATELVFPSNHLLAPYDLGALISSGIGELYVWERPRVWIIPTGSELVELGRLDTDSIPKGVTIESNSAMLAAMAAQAGARVEVTPVVRDDLDALKQGLLAAIDSGAHVVIINAGSSAGSEDYTAQAIEDLGEILVHGVTIMPGKPTILGKVRGRAVIGNPGYPVSCIISFERLVVPLLYRLQHRSPPEGPRAEARLARDVPSRSGMEEFRRGVAGNIGGELVATPLKRGAGSISTLTRANCIIRIPMDSEGLNEGETVEVELLRSEQDIRRTLLCTGSHDLTLDIIKDMLMKRDTPFTMVSSHVGSLGGIIAVKKDLTHVAGTHLLDPDTGLYNVTYVDKYLKGVPVRMFTLVHRQQGLMVRPGNPKGIKGIEDLAREDVRMVNRQGGSGTRVLLDYSLKRLGIPCDGLRGYRSEEYTHMAVAVAVLSGKADAGLGILAAARALGLDFIPVVEERYDLLVPKAVLELPVFQALMETIVSKEFKRSVDAMGGYSTRETGRTVLDT